MPMGDVSTRRAERIDYVWIDQQADLEPILGLLIDAGRYALDTEFHRERTYFPKLALIQVAWLDAAAPGGQRVALIDPLTVDVRSFGPLFASDSLCVIHAAQQDLDVLTHAAGAVPTAMFDTQIAAGFAGYGTPSLVSLLQGEVGVSPAKGDRLTDWLRRPLSDDQMQYAASDVEYLLEVHDRLVAKLSASGRIAWVADACEELRTKPVSGASPDDAWLRLKDARTLRPNARGVARSVAAWRERRAMRLDVPVRQVLPDLAILGISQRGPSTTKELGQARGVDDRHSRGSIADEILVAVREGRAGPTPPTPASTDDLERNLRPAVALISAWISQLARDESIDTALLATRSDLVAFLRGDADARLASGWRAELLGDGIRSLIAGESGLTFDGQGRLRLIPVAR
jgi:ribonuclease D